MKQVCHLCEHKYTFTLKYLSKKLEALKTHASLSNSFSSENKKFDLTLLQSHSGMLCLTQELKMWEFVCGKYVFFSICDGLLLWCFVGFFLRMQSQNTRK